MTDKRAQIIIAIDGYSSTGKSTVAKRLASALHYIYIDTGAMYRAVTRYALKKKYLDTSHFDVERLVGDLRKLKLQFIYNEQTGNSEMYLNGENIEREIRGKKVSAFVSRVAEVPAVRRFLVARQREMAKDGGVVMDGRDIGSVVFPDADVKFFLTAKPEIRAHRRWLEMREKGVTVSEEEIYDNILERDRIDSTRADSPLVRTPDAVEIDVSEIDREEQFDKMLSVIIEKMEKKQ